MYIRRLFYDRDTGSVIYMYMMDGDIVRQSVAEDFETVGALAGRTELDTGWLEWLTPDLALDAMFASHEIVRIENGEVRFGELFPEPEDTEPDEYVEALRILGVQV